MASSSSNATFKRILLLVTAAFTLVSVANATQSMRRPEDYKEPAHTNAVERNPEIISAASLKENETETSVERRQASGGRVNAAYFTNWSIYGAGYHPKLVPAADLTHILYSFADTDASSGALKLTDLDADTTKHFEGDSWSEAGNNLYGCLKQMYLHKLANRNLKVLLSVGGWTYSQSGHFNFVTNPAARATFVNDAIRFVEDYGFDGIDIDFEYPANTAQGQGFADLLTAMRTALNQLAQRKGDAVPYQLTVAVAAGASNYQHLNVPQMEAALNFWNLMSYDYAGSWDTISGHQANLYGPVPTGFETDAALKWYLSKGAKANKINHGLPMYGRAFQNTDGIQKPFSGIGQGTIEAGIYSYKFLPIAGAQVIEDMTLVASYSYDGAKRELVSYDSPNIIKRKTQYTIAQGLGGNFFWELAQDKAGDAALSRISRQALGTLDQTKNHINYPSSKYDNIKNNMGGGGGTNPPTDPPPTGGCGGLTAWSSSAVYTGGMQVSHNGRKWTAKWWTQNETPGTSDVWNNVGAC
ncbi:glycosyl hydrolases family 18-domain-containing protein [Pterulicium gracile]|uniref:chitinase n=1 Tax=Pterulicium gracile TaxID=1884261 RepID=A0A5C3Q625_9AGAR|nr:glycosyl hydrolases family 18-domain-containing protein [Pterula gracilis]